MVSQPVQCTWGCDDPSLFENRSEDIALLLCSLHPYRESEWPRVAFKDIGGLRFWVIVTAKHLFPPLPASFEEHSPGQPRQIRHYADDDAEHSEMNQRLFRKVPVDNLAKNNMGNLHFLYRITATTAGLETDGEIQYWPCFFFSKNDATHLSPCVTSWPIL